MTALEIPLGVLDKLAGSGIYGALFNTAISIVFVSGALLAFCFFKKKGGLDMDEEPKYQMMERED